MAFFQNVILKIVPCKLFTIPHTEIVILSNLLKINEFGK